ncbi:M48 family metallopeptidase [Undibacterium sp. Xuan67W]|uniref:M48 family metallopeptidase n=1 Tax=Undibacterium sp. Xuan67W TaxID=3413057 RepID=UPI003BF40D07
MQSTTPDITSEITPKTIISTPPKQRADLIPYANENTLFIIMAVVSALGWILLTLCTIGLIWIIMLMLYVVGLAAFSYFISYVRGNGVRVTAEQFPDLHARFETCCHTVGMKKRPEFYLVTGNGVLNAFATRFLHRYYVVLYSEIIDALEDDPEALNFYIGHELGHIAQKHLVHHWWLVFARWIPLLGSAYSRAREYTCDQYGLLCTNNKRSAVRALSVLAAGSQRWKTMNTQAYIEQTAQTNGFWMSLNELTADYPWLCKRVARIQLERKEKFPRRNVLAWIFATLIPNTGFGLIGAVIVYIYLGIFLVPIGLAAYSSYSAKEKIAAEREAQAPVRNQLSKAYDAGMIAAELVLENYKQEHLVPDSLDRLGFKNPEPDIIKTASIDPQAQITLELNPPLNDKMLKLTLSTDDDDEMIWVCTISGKVHQAALPEGCSNPDAVTESDSKSESSLFWKLFSKML